MNELIILTITYPLDLVRPECLQELKLFDVKFAHSLLFANMESMQLLCARLFFELPLLYYFTTLPTRQDYLYA